MLNFWIVKNYLFGPTGANSFGFDMPKYRGKSFELKMRFFFNLDKNCF